MNFATIGTSWITESFIDATNAVSGLNLIAVYSRSKEKAEEFAAKHNAKEIYTDIEKMAMSDSIDGVYIASPNSLHYSQSKLFLEHGKHVICEKPVATSGDLVEDLLAIAKKNNVIFMEAFKGSHMPQIELIKNAMQRLGKISAARFDFSQRSSKYDALQRGEMPNIFNPEFQTGCVMDIGIYCVYPALEFFSSYDKISAYAVQHENGIDLCGGSILCYPDKVVELSFSKVGDGRGVCEIVGDNGTLTIEKLSNFDEIKLYNKDGSVEVLQTMDKSVHSMQFEAQSFYDFATDMQSHREKYERLSRLAVEVSDTLKEIRKQCNIPF